MEANYVPFDRWMDKEDVVHIYKELLLSHKKELNIAICNNMDESKGYYANKNSSDRERKMPYDFTYMWYLKNKI